MSEVSVGEGSQFGQAIVFGCLVRGEEVVAHGRFVRDGTESHWSGKFHARVRGGSMNPEILGIAGLDLAPRDAGVVIKEDDRRLLLTAVRLATKPRSSIAQPSRIAG